MHVHYMYTNCQEGNRNYDQQYKNYNYTVAVGTSTHAPCAINAQQYKMFSSSFVEKMCTAWFYSRLRFGLLKHYMI